MNAKVTSLLLMILEFYSMLQNLEVLLPLDLVIVIAPFV
ncbi:hypothetical protein A2U01_0080773, partial [Trifolium medium]|nr:hypothetical protein [Trifolium medium]